MPSWLQQILASIGACRDKQSQLIAVIVELRKENAALKEDAAKMQAALDELTAMQADADAALKPFSPSTN